MFLLYGIPKYVSANNITIENIAMEGKQWFCRQYCNLSKIFRKAYTPPPPWLS